VNRQTKAERRAETKGVERLVTRCVRELKRKPRQPRSGITLQVLLEELEKWTPTYSPQGVAICEFICRTLFPLYVVAPGEIEPALQQIALIKRDCARMVAHHIWQIEQQLKELQTQ
jgi:hypothetical protein